MSDSQREVTHELAVLDQSSPATPAIAAALNLRLDLSAAVLSGRKGSTLLAYASDQQDFAHFMALPSPTAALDQLVSFTPETANAVAMAYRTHLIERDLSPATIARRLSALRTACDVARRLGRINWALEVDAPRQQAYRDTAGPGRDGWEAMLAKAKERATSPVGKRNLAIVLLLHDNALRRGEVVSLDLAHVELRNVGSSKPRLWILGKGRDEREPVTLPQRTVDALKDWIAVRGDEPGQLFCRLDRAGFKLGRLTGESIRRLVAKLGIDCGLTRVVRPHGLRHCAITTALELTKGNIAKVQRLGRHKDPKTTMKYNDNRTDSAGELATLLAGLG